MEPKPASLWMVTFDFIQQGQGKPRETVATQEHDIEKAAAFAAKNWPDRKVLAVESMGGVWLAG